jgi:hypothetical protein
MAQRLVGAALLMSKGTLRAGDDSFIPAGEDVLLVEAVAAVATALCNRRDLLMSLGAGTVGVVALGLLAEQGQDIHVLLGGIAYGDPPAGEPRRQG